MRRTAIGLFGDYRTFDITAKTLSPLLTRDVDLFIDVWDKSHCENKMLGISYNANVSPTHVTEAITPYLNGATLSVTVGKFSDCCGKFNELTSYTNNNLAYLQRFESVYKSIVGAGVEYDTVFVARPDLFYNTAFCDASRIREGVIYSSMAPVHNKKTINDMLFAAKFNTFSAVFKEFTPKFGALASDWHKWVYEFLMARADISDACVLSDSVIARPTVTNTDVYTDVVNKNNEWWYALILETFYKYGEEVTLRFWTKEQLALAKKQAHENRNFN